MALAQSQQAHACLEYMETNAETDELQHDLFVDISYQFTLAYIRRYLFLMRVHELL